MARSGADQSRFTGVLLDDDGCYGSLLAASAPPRMASATRAGNSYNQPSASYRCLQRRPCLCTRCASARLTCPTARVQLTRANSTSSLVTTPYRHPAPLPLTSPLLWARYGFRALARIVPPSPVKNQLLRWSGITVGHGAFVGDSVIVIDGFVAGLVNIEDQAVVSPGCCLIAMAYPEQSPLADDPSLSREAPITIGAGAWLGSLSVVMPGVTVGDLAVLGANSTATADVPPREIWAGSPARRIRSIDEERHPG